MLWFLLAVLSVLPNTIPAVLQERIYADDYYYYDETLDSTMPVFQEDSTDSDYLKFTGDSRFVAGLTCSSNSMQLAIDKGRLPRGLGLKENIEVNKNGGDFCQKTTQNYSHYIRDVSLSCDSALTVVQTDGYVTYSHEIFLEDIRSGRKPYTIAIECRKGLVASPPSTWDAVYRVIQNRQGSDCSNSCPYGQLCIQSDDVTGYRCDCTTMQPENCECSANEYRCSSSRGGREDQVIMCLRDDKVCDSNYDCPQKDDEMCADIFSDWSDWSSCDCKSGLKSRQRSCKRSLLTDETRTLRECISTDSNLTQTKNCKFRECSRVQCHANSMKIEIPFESGMTIDSAIRNMRLNDVTDDKECLPDVNSTHVVFNVPLHKCNTQTRVVGDVVFYTSTVRYRTEHDKNPVIVREYDHSYSARCQYQRRQTVSLERITPDSADGEEVAAFVEKSSGLLPDGDALDTVQHYSSGDGVFDYKMEIYTDISYSSRYDENDYPLKKRLGDRLYVGVSFSSQDEDLTVFIERCIAVSANDVDEMDDANRYLFIEGGCAVDATVNFHNTRNNSFSDRYSIQTFKFADAQYPYIYFRCDVIVCDNGEEDPACQRECLTSQSDGSRRRKRDTSLHSRTRSRLIQGPIVIFEEDDSFDLANKEGTVERDTFSTVQRSVQVTQRKVSTPSIPLPVIIGIVCLMLGVAVGLFLRRRKKQYKPGVERTQQRQLAEQDESQTVMMENC